MSWVGLEGMGAALAPLGEAELKAAYQDYQAQKDIQALRHQQAQDQAAMLRASQYGPVSGVGPVAISEFEAGMLGVPAGTQLFPHQYRALATNANARERNTFRLPEQEANINLKNAQAEALKNKPRPQTAREKALLLQLQSLDKDMMLSLDPEAKAAKVREIMDAIDSASGTQSPAAPQAPAQQQKIMSFAQWIGQVPGAKDSPKNRQLYQDYLKKVRGK